MPELPEVESIRRVLEPDLVGRTIVAAEIGDERLTRPEAPEAVADRLVGERIAQVSRRGKYLIVRYDSGLALLIHLRMTGSLRVLLPGDRSVDPHRRAELELDDGVTVAYRDVRRFGTWHLFGADELEEHLSIRLGPEPLEDAFTPELLRERLAGRRAPIKAALLDQRTVAGLGNIYVDEALWRARIHPHKPAGSLRRPAIAAVHEGIRAALAMGVARQGATLRDYALPSGESGGMQREFEVYGREGKPCSRCGTPIAKTRAGGRGTWFCPKCQR